MKEEKTNGKGMGLGWILLLVCFLVGAELLITLCLPSFITSFEAWYYLSQIVNCVIVTCGVAYAIMQYNLSVKDSKRNTDIVRVQKAIDLAQFFKDNILKTYQPIRYILDASGIADVLNKIPVSSMVEFSDKEMRKYITEKDTDILRNLQSSEAFLNALIDADSIYDMRIDFKAEINSVENQDKNTKKITYAIKKQPLINTFVNNYITETLNNLEFFAMHFTHNTADSSVVYQSLHQAYIEIVERLYYFIADLNTDPVDKYYTNVLKLYKKWTAEKHKNEEARRNSELASQTHGTVIE